MVPWDGLPCEIVVFPEHTHLVFGIILEWQKNELADISIDFCPLYSSPTLITANHNHSHPPPLHSLSLHVDKPL